MPAIGGTNTHDASTRYARKALLLIYYFCGMGHANTFTENSVRTSKLKCGAADRKADPMSNTMSIALSQQMALRRNMDVIANNLANMNTTAFKTESVIFEEYLMDVQKPDGNTESFSYVLDQGVNRDLTEGHQQVTGNPLDFSIKGPGYFVIETDAGERYTRNGNFTLNPEGQLVTKEGYAVLDTGRAPITFTPQDGEITVAEDGTISTQLGQRGQLYVVSFDNESELSKEGGSLFSTLQTATPVEDIIIVQGMTEQSNVAPIIEMTKMISVLRAYQSASELLKANQDMNTEAIRTLSGNN